VEREGGMVMQRGLRDRCWFEFNNKGILFSRGGGGRGRGMPSISPPGSLRSMSEANREKG